MQNQATNFPTYENTQLMKRFVFLTTILFLSTEAVCQSDDGLNLEEDLEPWTSLKRRAGYYTQSGRYRGGLYKSVRHEEGEVNDCVKDNGRYCLLWTSRNRNEEKEKTSSCACKDGRRQYCASWTCEHKAAHFDADYCRHADRGAASCKGRQHEAYSTCSCSIEAKNQKYCQQWLCTESSSHEKTAKGTYNCTKDRVEYCERWTGDILSENEVEAAACQCDVKQATHCRHWTCKDRGLKICRRKWGWCNFTFALIVAGGGGTICLLGGMFSGLKERNLYRRMERFYFGSVFCFLFTPGVLIWGGETVVPWVALMWGVTLLISLIALMVTCDINSVEPQTRHGESPA